MEKKKVVTEEGSIQVRDELQRWKAMAPIERAEFLNNFSLYYAYVSNHKKPPTKPHSC